MYNDVQYVLSFSVRPYSIYSPIKKILHKFLLIKDFQQEMNL